MERSSPNFALLIFLVEISVTDDILVALSFQVEGCYSNKGLCDVLILILQLYAKGTLATRQYSSRGS
jgi:hypothetical protein